MKDRRRDGPRRGNDQKSGRSEGPPRGRGGRRDERQAPRTEARPERFSPAPWDRGPKRGPRPAPRPERHAPPPPPRETPAPRGPRTETESLVYGLRSVVAMLRNDPTRLKRLVVESAKARQPDVERLVEDAGHLGIPVQKVDASELGALTRGAVHQGVVAEVDAFRFRKLEEILDAAEGTPLLLVLDEVQDPQNVGAAARAAWALGATGLVITRDRSATVTAAAEKVASGAFAHLPVAQVTNLARAIEVLKARGVWIIGLDVEAKAPVARQDLSMPTALVVGGEHEGMRRLTRDLCDALVHIPMAHPEAALNAADAAAVALYEAARQRAAAD